MNKRLFPVVPLTVAFAFAATSINCFNSSAEEKEVEWTAGTSVIVNASRTESGPKETRFGSVLSGSLSLYGTETISPDSQSSMLPPGTYEKSGHIWLSVGSAGRRFVGTFGATGTGVLKIAPCRIDSKVCAFSELEMTAMPQAAVLPLSDVAAAQLPNGVRFGSWKNHLSLVAQPFNFYFDREHGGSGMSSSISVKAKLKPHERVTLAGTVIPSLIYNQTPKKEGSESKGGRGDDSKGPKQIGVGEAISVAASAEVALNKFIRIGADGAFAGSQYKVSDNPESKNAILKKYSTANATALISVKGVF